ncbi:hypothetical protein DFP72DRAFT_847895 [Ephemerocybe angulata]|uniref:Uncharacterized protein n=1 Tax=Ephemerocybe angulata TaxID=980116 RepID=A0A8H6HXR3_9AGAR|nr:hypothetical protein DFP72DRAFT_847895 [Tulosesus angulatus]
MTYFERGDHRQSIPGPFPPHPCASAASCPTPSLPPSDMPNCEDRALKSCLRAPIVQARGLGYVGTSYDLATTPNFDSHKSQRAPGPTACKGHLSSTQDCGCIATERTRARRARKARCSDRAVDNSKPEGRTWVKDCCCRLRHSHTLAVDAAYHFQAIHSCSWVHRARQSPSLTDDNTANTNPLFYPSVSEISGSKAAKDEDALSTCTGGDREMVYAPSPTALPPRDGRGRGGRVSRAYGGRELVSGREGRVVYGYARETRSVPEVVVVLIKLAGIENYTVSHFTQDQTRRWPVGWSFSSLRLPDVRLLEDIIRPQTHALYTVQPSRTTPDRPIAYTPSTLMPEGGLASEGKYVGARARCSMWMGGGKGVRRAGDRLVIGKSGALGGEGKGIEGTARHHRRRRQARHRLAARINDRGVDGMCIAIRNCYNSFSGDGECTIFSTPYPTRGVALTCTSTLTTTAVYSDVAPMTMSREPKKEGGMDNGRDSERSLRGDGRRLSSLPVLHVVRTCSKDLGDVDNDETHPSTGPTTTRGKENEKSAENRGENAVCLKSKCLLLDRGRPGARLEPGGV